MAKNNEYASVLPKKILLSVFLFGLVLLAGRVLYLQFDGFSACFAARFAAKHPFLQFFAAPGADLPETACTAEPETAETKNAGSFVPPQYWPEAWTGVLAGF